MSDPKLAELIAMSGRATQGEWYEGSQERKDYAPIHSPTWGAFMEVCIPSDGGEAPGLNAEGHANAEFITALVNWFRDTYTKERA